jgi:aerobic-type carbon monoxide dehydrogenase small subunit (CoxS/CutS family)
MINTTLAANLCRCTGYQQIRMAVRAAAAAPPPTLEANAI